MGKRVDTRHMKKLRAAFFEDGRRLDAAETTRKHSVCWLCKQRIDYNVEQASTPDSHTLDHYHAVEDHPELQHDPSNFRHAHYNCNSSRGKRTPSAGLGEALAAWW